MARAKQQRVHREWFRPVTAAKCECGARRPEGGVWSWGEYVNAKWRTVTWFCRECFQHRVAGRLIAHAGPCGCTFELVGKGWQPLPEWITLEDSCPVEAGK